MRTILALAFAAITTSAFALTAVWAQPWNPATRLPAWQSVVVSAANLTPAKRMCFDDFRLIQGTPLQSISFWGWVSTPAQLFRSWHIAIHQNNPATNRPFIAPFWVYNGPLTSSAIIGPDLTGHLVNRCWLTIPTADPCNLPMGDYWLTVDEDDSLSVRPGAVPDFFWSAYQPIKRNPAIGYNWNGTFNQPLIDPANQMRDDLSFVLYK
jgi:hypothetical protein